MLLSARDAGGGSALSDEEIRNECVTLMIAGFDTTSNALNWALLEIARHPTVAARAAWAPRQPALTLHSPFSPKWQPWPLPLVAVWRLAWWYRRGPGSECSVCVT